MCVKLFNRVIVVAMLSSSLFIMSGCGKSQRQIQAQDAKRAAAFQAVYQSNQSYCDQLASCKTQKQRIACMQKQQHRSEMKQIASVDTDTLAGKAKDRQIKKIQAEYDQKISQAKASGYDVASLIQQKHRACYAVSDKYSTRQAARAQKYKAYDNCYAPVGGTYGGNSSFGRWFWVNVYEPCVQVFVSVLLPLFAVLFLLFVIGYWIALAFGIIGSVKK